MYNPILGAKSEIKHGNHTNKKATRILSISSTRITFGNKRKLELDLTLVMDKTGREKAKGILRVENSLESKTEMS